MNDKTETIGVVSRNYLGHTTMTTKKYIRHFAKHLSPDATKRTGKRFNKKDIEVLILAKALRDEGKSYKQVAEILDQELPVTGEVIDDIPPEPETEDVQPEDTALVPVEFFNRFVEQLQEQHQTTINAKDETINAKDEIIARQDTQIEDLEKQVERERQQKRQYYENLPRLVKWFTKPPE